MRAAVSLPTVSITVPRPALSGDIDHTAWDQLLKRYVTPQSRIDYLYVD